MYIGGNLRNTDGDWDGRWRRRKRPSPSFVPQVRVLYFIFFVYFDTLLLIIYNLLNTRQDSKRRSTTALKAQAGQRRRKRAQTTCLASFGPHVCHCFFLFFTYY
jgi:hypothetical protein